MAKRAEQELDEVQKKIGKPDSYDDALTQISDAFAPKKYKDNLKKSFKKSEDITLGALRDIGEFEKKRFRDTINSAVRKNDVIFKQLQKDFMDKENDIVALWHLFKEAWSLLSVIKFEDGKKQTAIMQTLKSRFNIARINKLYAALVYQKEMNVWHSFGDMKIELMEAVDGDDGEGHMILLSFVSAIFDDTEVAKETAPQDEEFSQTSFDEELGD